MSANTDIALKQGGDTFQFFSEDYEVNATFLRAFLYGKTQVTTIANSAGVLSVTNVPLYDGTVIYSLADAASNASAYIQGAVAGQEKTIVFRTGAVGSIFFSTATGVTLMGPLGEISSINAHGSAASMPYIKMVGTDTDEWAVVDTAGQVTLNLAS